MMETFDISQDDDESDTSQEDIMDGDSFEDIHDFGSNLTDVKFQEFKRKPVPPNFLEKCSDFNFFLMDCDFGIISTKTILPDLIPISHCRLPPICTEQSYVRLHGITESGNSICCNVFGFLPYFYVVPSFDFVEENIQQFKDLLTKAVIKKILTSLGAVPYHDIVQNCPIVSVEVFDLKNFSTVYDLHLSGRSDSGSLYGTTNILKITCSMPKFVWTAAKLLKCNEIQFSGVENNCRYELYEAAINHTIRFLSDTNLCACTWLQITSGNYTLRTEERKLSQAQLEIDVFYGNLGKVPAGEDLADIVPLIVVLSFDIECMVRPKKFNFPRDGSDLVLQIGNVLTTYGSSDAPRKIVFALGECNKSDAAEILSFQNEREMLEAWRAFILSADPDILMGYNIRKFDIPYLVDRANEIGLNRFSFLGRIKASPSMVRPVKPGPKQMYEYDDKKVIISGRVILDMYLLMMRHNTIPGKCSLADVCVRYLKTERKIDVHYKEIFRMQNLSNQTRTSLAEYCIQDAVLPYLLLQSHNPNRIRNPSADMLSYYIDKARRTGAPLKYLITKSKAYSMYFRMVRTQKNPAVPFVPDTPTPVKSKSRRPSQPSVPSGTEFSPKRLNFDDSHVETFDPSYSTRLQPK